MPVTMKPNGFSIPVDKRPDGLTLLPWHKGRPLAWDVTVICPSAVSYVSGYTPGAAAELAASRKCEKYANLYLKYEPDICSLSRHDLPTSNVLNDVAF